MRFVVAIVFLGACSDRCGHDSARVADEASAFSALPPPSASVFEGDAHAPFDAATLDAATAIDAGCLSAHDDAIKRFQTFCANDESCQANALELAPSNKPSKVADLDDDGVPEIMWGWGPIPINNESHLYRGGTACAVHLGSLGGPSDLKAKSTRHEGYRDIVVEDYSICEGASGGCTPEINGYIFRAGQYEIDPKQHVAGTVKLVPEDPR